MSFVTLTFAGQDRIIVNTNTFGTRKIAVFSTIEQTLGMKKDSESDINWLYKRVLFILFRSIYTTEQKPE